MDQDIQATIQRLNPQETKEALKRLDHPTLHSAAAVISQVGFSHFELSLDTRIALEARKAHRFVAINCEEIAKKVLRLSGAPEPEIEDSLMRIAAQIRAYKDSTKATASLQPVSEKLKQ